MTAMLRGYKVLDFETEKKEKILGKKLFFSFKADDKVVGEEVFDVFMKDEFIRDTNFEVGNYYNLDFNNKGKVISIIEMV